MRFHQIAKLMLVNLKLITRSFSNNKKLTPYKILFQLTNDCNSQCDFCHIWTINKQNPSLKNAEVNIQQYEKLLKDYGDNIYWIALSGGEVSLFENFKDLLDLINKYCPNLCVITFTTNGLLPSKILEYSLYIKQQLRSNLFVTISLDGPMELHDKLRGIEGNFLLAHETHKLLRENKINSHFGLTLNQKNANHFKNVAIEKEVKAISLVHSGGIYHKKNSDNDKEIFNALKKVLKHYRIRSLGELIEYCYLKISMKYIDQGRIKNIIPCENLSSNIHLDPYGNVKPCMYMESIGNIKDKKLSELLELPETLDVLKKIKNDQCPKCWMNCYAPHSMIMHPFKTFWHSL